MEFSYLQTLLISCPEQVVLTITVLILIARHDLFKPKPKNIAKLAVVSVLNGFIVDAARGYCPSFVLSTILYTIAISITLTFILKIRWPDTVIATILMAIEVFLVETVFYSIVIGCGLLNYDVAKNSDFLSTMWSLPVRLIEIGICIGLFHVKVVIIDLKPFAKAKGFIGQFSVFAVTLLFGFAMITNVFKTLFLDMKLNVGGDTRDYLLTNLFFAISVIIASVAQYIKSRKKAESEKEQYLSTLGRLSSLLQTGDGDIIKALDVINNERDRWEATKK